MLQNESAGNNNAGEERFKPVGNKLIPFLCYAKENQTVVREFSQQLKSEGWIDPWFDEEDILPGQIWQDSVISAVRQCHAVIVFLSKETIASEGFYQKELKLALDTAAEKTRRYNFYNSYLYR